jgi:hypothetical protein
MVSYFLLHDSSDIYIRGISGETAFGKLPEQWRSIAKSWLPPSGDQSKILELEHSWARNGGKSLPCQESVAAV